MTQSVDVPTQEFCLDWTLTGNRGNHVGVTLSGQVKLLDGNRFYKVDGVLYLSSGTEYCRELGNLKLFVRRNAVEVTGRQWGWEVVSARQSIDRLRTMDAYFVRTGYWAPADRAIQLSLGAEFGLTRRKTYSPALTIRMLD
ncbi:MAG TPA: hypothetical protein VJX66_03325 [Amycolatopsis sp.]|nr:hypothetical protein [Amycolatopsis sp.]